MPSLFQKVLSIFKKKEVRHVEIDPESVKKHNLIRALANENAELKGEKAKLISDLGKLRESKKDLEEEDEIKIELNEQKQELEKKIYPKYFSLEAFFRKIIKDKEFKQKLGFYPFDGSEKLAKYGDFGLASNGNFILLDDKGVVILQGKNLNDIFWSVGGLNTDIKAKKIPLCLDKDFGYIENPMVWEAPELIPTKEGKFRYAKARKKPFYEHIKQLMNLINGKQEYIEELELTLTDLHKENDDLKVSQRVAEDSSETSKAELGQAELSVSAIGRVFRGTERELSQIRDTNVILEDNVDKLEKVVETLRAEAEKEGSKLSFDKAMESIQQIRRELVRDEPSKEVKIIEVPAKITQESKK